MLETLLQLVVATGAGLVVLYILIAAWAPRYQFMVRIRQGEPVVVNGKVSAEFLDQVRAVCQEFAITSGWIGGIKRGKAIALRFSRDFPPPCQQRLRNAWFSP